MKEEALLPLFIYPLRNSPRSLRLCVKSSLAMQKKPRITAGLFFVGKQSKLSLFQHAKLLTHFGKGGNGAVEMVFIMAGRKLHADTC
jgi:hypothetical protein